MRRTPVLLLIAAVVAFADPPLGDDWKYDVVYPKNAVPLRGLILEKTDTHVILRCVRRKPGSPTITIRESVPLHEVDHIDALGPADREVLVTRLKNLARERETLSAHLKALDRALPGPGAADRLTLTPTEWVQKDRAPGLEYATPHFRLVSNSREAVVQLVALQLEQVYTAYQQSLPPRPKLGQATRILLTGTRADYQALVMARGGNFLNPAFYDVERNEIVCHSEIERLHDELEKTRQAHARALAELDQRAAELKELYKSAKTPEPYATAIGEEKERILAQEKQNAALFELGKQRLFVRLYHEAFHAYLANFVFPPGEAEVPRWLNEGLAQIFETAIIEAGDLRVGHIDKGRYDTIRTAAGRGTVLPLADLLRSKERDFLVAHAGDKPTSDRMYLASWALAHYLTFERKVLGTPALEAYVKELKRGGDPLGAFRDLVGQPLEAFEKDFHGYLQRLRQDGTAGR